MIRVLHRRRPHVAALMTAVTRHRVVMLRHLLAGYLARATAIAVDAETVRVYLHAHDYVCKRPTWTLKRKAQEHEGYVGNA